MKKQLFILTLVLTALLPVELWAQGSTGSEDGSDPVAAPTFRFDGDYLVIETATEDASIFYQMADLPDMSDETIEKIISSMTVTPDVSQSMYYEQPILLQKSVVLKAIAAGATNSEVSTLVYDYDAWNGLLEAIEYGWHVQELAKDNANVDADLKEELQWALDESKHIFDERATIPYQEAQHFANQIYDICDKIEEQMSGQATAEPYAVLSENNTVLTFYYDDQKTARNGLSVGPFSNYGDQSWADNRETITTAVFDASFANCTTLTSTAWWFYYFENLTAISGIENLKTDSVTDMSCMFSGCSSLTKLDLSGFNTAKVTNMTYLFSSCSSLTSLNLNSFDTSNVKNMSYVFGGCSNLSDLDLNSFNTTSVTDMRGMFVSCSSLTSIDLDSFNTSAVSSMAGMFAGCSALSNLDLRGFSTANVWDMSEMFTQCSSLENLNLSSFDTSIVTDMRHMFSNCFSLTSLDLSGLNTAKVIDMRWMFRGCSALSTIYAGANWSTIATKSGEDMFSGCTNLVGGAGTVYDANHTDYTYAHIDGGAANPGYFTDKNAPVSSDDLEIYAVEHNSTIVPNETIAATPSIRLTPGNDTQWNTEYSIAIDNDSEDLTIDFTASIYYPGYTTTYEFLGSMYGTNNPKDSLLADGVSSGAGYKYYLRNLPLSGGYVVFEALQDGSLIVPVHINPKKQFYVVDANGKVKTDIQLKDASGQTLTMLSSPLCAVSDEKSVTAFASFNVKQGESYYMFCTGSKMRFGGYVFSKLPIDIDPVTMAAVKDELESSPVEYDGLVLRVGSDVSMGNALRAVGGISAVGSNIAAVVWNSNKPIANSELQELTNPNMLIYVKADSLAPQNRDNVIVGDVAKNIVLTDVAEGNGSFYCPQDFKAEMISYTRNFSQQTEVGVARGWETIALPFTVQTITHETKGLIAPFGNDASNKHFWLRQLTENGLARATEIEPNTAYLISMPNNDAYYADFNLNGLVTFSSVDVWVPKTQIHAVDYHTEKGMVVLLPNFQRRASDYTTYALNVGEQRGDYPEGSVFEREYRDIRPFEAYTFHQGSPAPRFLPISDLNGDDATGIEEVRSLRAEGRGNVWYDMSGRRLQQKPAGKGVYILNGRKVVIK